MKTIELKLYSFSELSEEAKEKALNNFNNTDGAWWDNVYSDAEDVGLKITSFNLDYNTIEGDLTKSLPEVIELILNNHGSICDTYITAERFKEKVDKLDQENNETQSDEEEAIELEERFLEAILADYLVMLKDELDYLNSDAYKIELIEANDYTFEEDGTMRNN